ncbi:MAG TPA: hypothetical protein VGF86_16080 [Candidatus Tumulicola sp.]|jgi:hypothetical protein
MTEYTIGLCDTTGPLEKMLARLDAGETAARSRVHLGIAWIAMALRFPSRAREHLKLVDPRAVAGAADIRVRYHHVAACVAKDMGDVDTLRREHAAWLEAAWSHGAGAVAGAYYNGAKYFSVRPAGRSARKHRSRAARGESRGVGTPKNARKQRPLCATS